MSIIKDKEGFEYILLKKDTGTMMVLNETAKHILLLRMANKYDDLSHDTEYLVFDGVAYVIDWSLSEQDVRVIKGQTFING
jgi:hypothetical protein